MSLTVASPVCDWNAFTTDSWITLTSGISGIGNGTVAYSVAANSAASARTGTIIIADLTFTVMQSAACSYSISPARQVFPSSGGSAAIEVTAQDSCGWAARTDNSWITINSGPGTGNGLVDYSVAVNNTGSNRLGSISVRALSSSFCRRARLLQQSATSR